MIPALILAGGRGTRLRGVIGDLPKPLADIADKPFLWWLLRQLEKFAIGDAYLSVGYRHEMVRAAMGDVFGSIALHYVVEDEPLGTGGAILAAASVVEGEELLVFNGDTMSMLDLADFVGEARRRGVDLAVALARVADPARYGTVEIDPQGRITAFREKGVDGSGLINGGIYYLRKTALARFALPPQFSFEHDYLMRYFAEVPILGLPRIGDFIDIGVPEDYRLAQTKIPALVG